jgi:hypothetical protein
MHVIHHRHARHARRDPANQRRTCGVCMDERKTLAAHDIGDLPHQRQIETSAHRRLEDRGMFRRSGRSERAPFEHRERHVKPMLAKSQRKQVLHALRAGIMIAVDDVQHARTSAIS